MMPSYPYLPHGHQSQPTGMRSIAVRPSYLTCSRVATANTYPQPMAVLYPYCILRVVYLSISSLTV